jgi:hypothetical protein
MLIALALCVILLSCGGGSSSLSTPVTVEINSDSICSATGIKVNCAQMLPSNWVIDDRAIAGLTLHSLFAGYSEVWVGGPLGKNGVQAPFDQINHSSQFVVLEFGANDAYDDYPADRFESELRAMLLYIKDSGKTPVVTGIVPFRPASPDHPGFDAATVSRSLVLNAITHRVATEMSVLDAHWDIAPFDADADTVDGMHRTEPALRMLVIQAAAATVSLVTLAVAVAGPLAGPYLVIVLGGVSGGLWALSSVTSSTRMEGGMLLLRCVLTAVLLTAVIAQVLGSRFGLPVTELYGVVSLVIGMLGNRWQDIIDAIRDKVRALITRAPDPTDKTGGPKP